MIKSFALDRNCLIDLDEDRPNATHVRALVASHAQGKLRLSVLGISASERLKSGAAVSNFAEYRSWLAKLGCQNLGMLAPIGVWGVTYWDNCLHGEKKDHALLADAFSIMFPSMDIDWVNYAKANKEDPSDLSSQLALKWKNALCDAQAIWACIKYDQDAFVTSNTQDFQKKFSRLSQLGLKLIFTPKDAVDFLNVQSKSPPSPALSR